MDLPPKAQSVADLAEACGLRWERVPVTRSGQRAPWTFYAPGGSEPLGAVSGDTPALAWVEGYRVGRGGVVSLTLTRA